MERGNPEAKGPEVSYIHVYMTKIYIYVIICKYSKEIHNYCTGIVSYNNSQKGYLGAQYAQYIL
jgi:hypothetical protein